MNMDIRSHVEDFAALVRNVCGASSAAVLLSLDPAKRSDVVLAASGDVPIPELADPESAWLLVSSGDSEAAGNVQRLSCSDARGSLIVTSLANIFTIRSTPPAATSERREFPVSGASSLPEGRLWVGVTEPENPETFAELFDHQNRQGCQLSHVTLLAARILCKAFLLYHSLRDPVSHLPGRSEYESALKWALTAAINNRQPLGVLLINPDDFVMVNHRFGRSPGDRALREIAARLKDCVRDTDSVFRYGGAAFGVLLPATSPDNVESTANRFQRTLSDTPYLDARLDLSFSIGGAIVDDQCLEIESFDLIRRAEYALHQAKLTGHGRIVLSAMSETVDDLGHFDPASGIFTAEAEKDYRNMLMLWETVALVSSTPDPLAIARNFVDRLGDRFQPDRVVLACQAGSSELEIMATNCADANEPGKRLPGANTPITADDSRLISRALKSRQLERETGNNEFGARYALPLIAADNVVGCLVLDGMTQEQNLDATDLMFLNALANQIAMALDRAALAANQIRQKALESRKLREEVQELRHALNRSEMIYESHGMRVVIETLQKVAPTDATVLIYGESGTGKEMLAHALHNFSNRRDDQFVTVDCGVIAHTLLEAELFGRSKGAYTGADSASEGRILQADGGTLFLDEVGELPLDVQAKLLRFVQEREISPVGSNTTRKVDVRIVAATNRNLGEEVSAGRFREDLFYRLQVVSVEAPPLRQRREDITVLSSFFLEKFSAEHGSKCTAMTTGAQRRLMSYDWPGNVRELKHCILRSVLMCDGETLNVEDIRLQRAWTDGNGAANILDAESSGGGTAGEAGSDHNDDPLQWLQHCLQYQVDEALQHNKDHPVPIGRWLNEDLVLAVSSATDQVGRRGARMIGIPESTFRRQVDKARAEFKAGLALRTDAWAGVGEVLDKLVGVASDGDGHGLLERARSVLLEIVAARTGPRHTVGAALMGVTPPTYKRWLNT